MENREWLYLLPPTSADVAPVQKGPVSASVLTKMMEKNLSGISGQTLVWKEGMQSWIAMSDIEPFQTACRFNLTQWFFLDPQDGKTQHGPVLSSMMIHKMQTGKIDGMTLVYSAEVGEWRRLADVPFLKAACSKKEREAGMPDVLQAQPSLSSGTKRSFVADNGQRYIWSEGEQDWVEVDDWSGSEGEEEAYDEEDKSECATTNAYSGSSSAPSSSSLASVVLAKISNRTTKAKGDGSGGEAVADDDNDGIGDDDDAARPERSNLKRKHENHKKKKKNKKKLSEHNWVYITGLPLDASMEEIKDHFSKVGLIAISVIDQTPRIKMYRDDEDNFKGDCSICYNAAESVKMAVDVLHGGYIRPNFQIAVTKADFSSSKPDAFDGKSIKQRQRPIATQSQVKTVQSVMKQALAWNEDDDTGVDRSKALRIVVLEGMFSPSDFSDPEFSDQLEQDIANECGKLGDIDKITVFSKNPRGIVIVKFKTAFAAQECISVMNGRFFGGNKLRCFYWDGSTNYSVSMPSEDAEKEEKERLDEFGDWLDQEQDDLPEEFRLQVEA